MLIEIDLKRVSYGATLGFTLLMCLTAAMSGCADPPDEDLGEYAPDDYVVGCAVGEVEDWGDGYVPRIAGSPDGFAVTHSDPRQPGSFIRMVGPDGTPTGPVQNLLASDSNFMSKVDYGRNGYIVRTRVESANDPSTAFTNMFLMGQDGAIAKSFLGLPIMHELLEVASDGETDRAVWDATADPSSYPACPQGPIFTGHFSSAGNLLMDSWIGLLCPNSDGMYWSLQGGMATADGTIAFGVNKSQTETAPWHYVSTVYLTRPGSNAVTEVKLADVRDVTGWPNIHRIVAVPEGYAVLWTRFSVPNQQVERTTTLTVIGTDGQIKRSVVVPDATDIAWNGHEYGAVEQHWSSEELRFHRISEQGLVLKTEVVDVGNIHWVSWPKIASSGDGFGIVWGSQAGVPDVTLKFAPVECLYAPTDE